MRPVLLAVLCLVALVGCGSSARLHGTWTGSADIPRDASVSEGVANTLSRVELTFLPGNRFRGTISGIPVEGAVRPSEGAYRLVADLVAGREVPPTGGGWPVYVVKVREDGGLDFSEEGKGTFAILRGATPAPNRP